MAVRYGYNPILEQWVVLSEVMNGYPFATDAETLAGTIDVKAVTPASLASIKDVDTGIVGKDSNGEILVDGINIATDDLANPDPRNITWNIDEGTLDLEMYDGVVMQVGEELMIRGKAIEDIPDGSVVMYGGALGDNIKLKVADASAEGFLPRWILGIATHSIDQNKWGYVTKVGKVRGVNTTSFAEGAVVYFDPTTPGGLTATQPEAPCCKVPMGAILRSQNDGIIFVRPEFNPNMAQVNDVHIDTITDGHILKWDGTDERFENVPYPVTQTITEDVTTTAPSEGAVFDALALKAPLASPALTGNPTAPTAAIGTNNTQIATTAFVIANIGGGGGGTGDVVGPSSSTDSNFAAFDGITGKLIKDSTSKASDFATASHSHSNATTEAAGFMSAYDKTKLDGLSGEGASLGVVIALS